MLDQLRNVSWKAVRCSGISGMNANLDRTSKVVLQADELRRRSMSSEFCVSIVDPEA